MKRNHLFVFAMVSLSAAGFGLLAVDAPAGEDKQLQGASRRIVVQGTNDLPRWMVRVAVDREDRTYRVDDRMTVKVQSEKCGYLYLFNVDCEDKVFLLYPNAYQKSNHIDDDTEVTIPDPDDTKFRITIGTPVGKEYLKAIVTKKPIKSLDAMVKKLKPGQALELKKDLFSRVAVEAMHLKPGQGTVAEKKQEARKQFEQFQKEAKDWAEHTIDIITLDRDDEPKQARRVGLFVGVSKYKSHAIRELKCAHLDAIKMAEVMKKRCALDKVTVVTNEKATRSNVEKTFREELVEKTKPGDFVVIYWSGHGGRCANTDKNEPDAFDAYLVPHEGSLANAVEERKTMLLDKTFGSWVQRLDGRKVIVIIDTCHSGGQIEGTKSSKKEDDRLEYARGVDRSTKRYAARWTKSHFLDTEMVRSKAIGQKSAAVLASATFKQLAWERREGDLGVMTYFLVERLQKGKGPLTLEQLADYVRPRVKQYVEDEFAGATQDIVFSDQDVNPPAQVRK